MALWTACKTARTTPQPDGAQHATGEHRRSAAQIIQRVIEHSILVAWRHSAHSLERVFGAAVALKAQMDARAKAHFGKRAKL